MVVGLALVTALTLVACSGGDDSSSGGDSKGKATTTTTPAQADETTAQLAAGLVFAEDDFPDGWTVAVEPLDYATKGIAVDECLNPAGGLLAAVPRGATVSGPTMKSPDVPFFISTWSATFPDEATAIAWSEELDTDERTECQRSRIEKGAADGVEVRTVTSPESAATVGQDHRVAVAEYELTKDDEVVSLVHQSAYRVGRTVVTVRIEVGPMQPEQQDAGLAVEAQLRGTVFDRVTEIEPASP